MKTIITGVAIVGSFIFNWGMNVSQVSDLQRRMVLLEQQVVPRSETTVRDKGFEDRLNRIELKLDLIQERLGTVTKP